MGTPGTRNSKKPLAKYWQKRNFDITSEPRGEVSEKQKESLAYFIQRHHARRLHYDFRLEMNGTLKSWAIPKGPSLDPADKRLAVQVEDHPLDYGTFEGEIPEHQYGAGKVYLWDRGVWTPEGNPEQGLHKGHIKFRLQGEKLSGNWALVRMGPSSDEKENWLLIKEHDDEAKTGKAANITVLRPESVLSGSDAAGKKKAGDHVKRSGVKTKSARVGAKSAAIQLDEIEGERKIAMPSMIKPQLATLADRAPETDEWLLEIKFDGYRAVTRIENSKARIFTRAANDWTHKWKDVAHCAAQLGVDQAWLDGEVVAIDEHGAVSFQLLQNMDRDKARARLAYYVFDLLYLNGHDLRDVPLIRRKEILKSVLTNLEADGPILFSDHMTGNARDIFSNACGHNLEGIIAKRADARYESTRSRSWLKVKCHKRQEFVIGGYTDPAGSRDQFGALLVGVYDEDGKLRYAGKVGTGFSGALLKTVAKELAKVATDKPTFVDPPTGYEARGAHWVKPALVAEIKFAQWTDSGHIRHAAFVGLRNDKPPQTIRHETALPVRQLVKESEKAKAPSTRARAKTTVARKSNMKTATSPVLAKSDDVVAGVKLSHPSRVLFPEMGFTKLELAQYYDDVAEWILPQLCQRPLTLVRCPDGAGKQCFYQKHANQTTGSHIARVVVPNGEDEEPYMMANSRSALISLVQMGVLELHTWGARAEHLDKPDRMIFDLDPAPELKWSNVVDAAFLVKALLEEIGLRSFLKTTGGKGLHIVVPLKPERSWDEVKAFSRSIAYHLANILPDCFTAKMTKSTRTGKIFIDYLRNGIEATAVAAYSTRARPGAPVSTPIGWEELGENMRSDSFNVANIRERLRQLKHDPWKEYYNFKQRITLKMLRTFESK